MLYSLDTEAHVLTAAGIGRSCLSAIETGRKPGSIKALQGIAGALGVTIDDLVEPACTGGAGTAQ